MKYLLVDITVLIMFILSQHPFVAKAKSSAVMRQLIDQAQVVIDAAGGRLQALKEISARKAHASK